MPIPNDPNAAARGLRMPGVGAMLNSAGSVISNAASSLRDGASSLYNRTLGADPATPAPAAAPASAATPTPAATPAPTAASTTQSMRTGVPPIPTLTDVIKPTAGVNNPVPTMTNPSIPAGGMSPERAAWESARAGSAGGGLPPVPPTAAATGPEAFGRNLGMATRQGAVRAGRALSSPTAGGIVGGLTSFAPHWDAMDDNSGLTVGQKAKLALRDTTRAAGGIVGGAAGAVLGSGVPVAGTVAGGALGATAGYEGVDALGGGLRRTANWITEKLGGAPDYITSTDDDLRAHGFDPNRTIFNAIGDSMRSGQKGAVAVVPPAAGTVAQPAAPAVPSAPAVPGDVADFNARMKQVGADSISMRAMTPSEIGRYNSGPMAAGAGDVNLAYSPNQDPNKGMSDLYAARSAAANAGNTARVAQLDAQINAAAAQPRGNVTGMGSDGGPAAGSLGMRAGPGARVLENTQPASKEMQDYTARHMQERTNQLANADASYEAQRQQSMGLGAGSPLVTGGPLDMNRLNDDIEQAKRSGSPAQIQSAYAARDNALRTVSGDRQALTQAALQRRGQDVTSADNIRTTNATLMGNERMAAVAARSYDLENRKYGSDLDKTANEERTKAESALADHLGTMFTTKDDKGNTVPDKARVGDAVTKLHDELGAQIAEARATPPNDPHYTERQQLATELEKKGMAALGDDDKRILLSQLAIRDRAKQLHGSLPGKATFVDSRLNGYTAQGVGHNLLGSDTVNLRNGGSIRANDLRYTEPANTFWPDVGKQQTDEFNAGLRGKN